VIMAAALAACPYGAWDQEVVQITAAQATLWEYRELKPNEQTKTVDRYYADSHERIALSRPSFGYLWLPASKNRAAPA
jgi:hypothetical protein